MNSPVVPSMRLLFLTAEGWPTFRADVATLFGKYLPRHGIVTHLLTERDGGGAVWPGGEVSLFDVPRRRSGFYVVKLWHSLRGLLRANPRQLDAIQVRDMSVTALAGLIVARCKGLRFFYWLSYPQSEGQIHRAKARGLSAGMRFWFPLMQGWIGQWLLYRIVLPRADHVFVQSRRMQEELAGRGIPMQRMTPVPMGVDTEVAHPDDVKLAEDSRLVDKRVLVYLGTLDRVRNIDLLFHMLARVKMRIPDVLLVLAGDTEDAEHRAWLKQEAELAGVAAQVLWTGWLPAVEAWRYARAAEVGLSPIPRGYLLDMGSPTKAVEYLALGIPVVANDNPDQAQVIAESGAGLCVSLEPEVFAEAVLRLLDDPGMRREMGERGRRYLAGARDYASIACHVAEVYFRFQASR